MNHSRPSIDVLFESAARAWRSGVIGVLLTGASPDGAAGMLAIRGLGGRTFAQDPAGAEHPVMPRSAIEAGGVERIATLREIGAALNKLAEEMP
ncbi:MAG: chemotaxis protein CheB [Elusimicrobiota bacterium]